MHAASAMTTLDLKAAFFHVIDPHRWLAASGCAWNLVGANAANGTKKETLQLLPNIDVMVRDCLLLHARSLIKFYRNVRRGDTDIILSDFGVKPIDQQLGDDMKDYEQSIEVHLLHLADWRDSDYRRLHAIGNATTRDRRDWDSDASRIVDLTFEALKYVSEQNGQWQQPVRDLYDASTGRYLGTSY